MNKSNALYASMRYNLAQNKIKQYDNFCKRTKNKWEMI